MMSATITRDRVMRRVLQIRCHTRMVVTADRDSVRDARWPAWADLLAARLLGELKTTLGGLQIAYARRIAIRVASTQDESLIATALLHEVLEKTRVTSQELRHMSGNSGVVDLVDALTHQPNESYEAYLTRCARDPRTILLKRLDLLDKLDTDDVHVPKDLANQIRHEAASRLRRLNRIAAINVNSTDSADSR